MMMCKPTQQYATSTTLPVQVLTVVGDQPCPKYLVFIKPYYCGTAISFVYIYLFYSGIRIN